MNDVAQRTAKLKEAVTAKVSGISVQEEENLRGTLRWLEFKNSTKLVEVEVHADWYGVSDMNDDTAPFTKPDHVFQTHDEALEKIVDIFRKNRAHSS